MGRCPAWFAAVGTVVVFGATFATLQVQRAEIAKDRRDRIEAVKRSRRRALSDAIAEALHDADLLQDGDKVQLKDEHLNNAYRLVSSDAVPGAVDPLRWACQEVGNFNSWDPPSTTAMGRHKRIQDVRVALDEAVVRLRDLDAAIDQPGQDFWID